MTVQQGATPVTVLQGSGALDYALWKKVVLLYRVSSSEGVSKNALFLYPSSLFGVTASALGRRARCDHWSALDPCVLSSLDPTKTALQACNHRSFKNALFLYPSSPLPLIAAGVVPVLLSGATL
jgi:hypothetical protein